MKKEEFEQKIQAMIPRPSPETTADLYELGLEVLDENIFSCNVSGRL